MKLYLRIFLHFTIPISKRQCLLFQCDPLGYICCLDVNVSCGYKFDEELFMRVMAMKIGVRINDLCFDYSNDVVHCLLECVIEIEWYILHKFVRDLTYIEGRLTWHSTKF